MQILDKDFISHRVFSNLQNNYDIPMITHTTFNKVSQA